jgi:hypothetical protein
MLKFEVISLFIHLEGVWECDRNASK